MCRLGVSAASQSYDTDYYAHTGYRDYFERGPQWRFEARRRLERVLSAGAPRRLLEVGCAGGFFIWEAERLGIDALGVELSPLAAGHARETLGVDVVTAAFEDAPLDGTFGAVCAFHVLEHVADPRGFLTRARDLLEPGGLLALETPNFASAAAARWGARWDGLQPESHRWHFDPWTLPSVAEQTGFETVSVDTVFARHYHRPARRVHRAAIALAVADVRATHSLRTTHPTRGDYVRLLARRAG
jgi:2-polyprenyl-3-methyl-5-hydroxy-6-metoxy-1,4-benzoquinol methylase